MKTRIIKIGNSQGIRIPKLLLGQLPVGIKDEEDCFLQVGPSLIKGGALRICARQLLNKPDIALGHLLKYGG